MFHGSSFFALFPKITEKKIKEEGEGNQRKETTTTTTNPKLLLNLSGETMADKGRPLPKFGEWDVNDPSSAEGFTVIFNKARNEKKGGGKSDSPGNNEPGYNKNGQVLGKPPKKWFCCIQSNHAE